MKGARASGADATVEWKLDRTYEGLTANDAEGVSLLMLYCK